MNKGLIHQAVEFLEKANADLEPEILTASQARILLSAYALAEKLAGFGVAALSRKLNDAGQVAKATGTSLGKAKAVVATGKVLNESAELEMAMAQGNVSLDQAAEIAAAEQSAPGAARDLLKVAASESFHALKDKARATKLEAEQHKGLAERQHRARSGRSYVDSLGMTDIHLSLEPHIGSPIVTRAEAEAARLAKKAKTEAKARLAKKNGHATREDVELEPFERHLADAYASLLYGNGKGRAKRPELVILVSQEVATRGWKDVRQEEVCKIPGVGPVAPRVAKNIAQDAFVNAVIYDGKDLRQFKRWSRSIPVEIQVALELGEPPEFDGVKCIDCGNRFRTEFDHLEARVLNGPTALWNIGGRCWPCHLAKTKRDLQRARKSGAGGPGEAVAPSEAGDPGGSDDWSDARAGPP